MKRVLLIATVLVCMSSVAVDQDCTIAAYGDPGGTNSWASVGTGLPVSIYVVLFAEDAVGAAAYSIEVPPWVYRQRMFLQGRFTGPSRDGLFIDEPTGTNSALGECAIGFGGNPVLVDEYVFVIIPYSAGGVAGRGPSGGAIELGPNASQDADWPQYVTCADVIKDCAPGPALWVDGLPPVPVQSRSMGAIKSLFAN